MPAAWESVRMLPNPLSYHAGVKYNNGVITIGGVSNGAGRPYVSKTRDGVTGSFIAEAPVGLSARFLHAACVFDERMWVSGGYDGTTELNDVLVSEDGVTWTHICNMVSAARNHRMLAFGNERVNIVRLGGYNGTAFINNIYKSSDGRNWNEVSVIGSHWDNRSGFGALVYKGKLWVFGGIGAAVGGLVARNDVWWTDDLIHWHQALASAPWSKRCDFGYCVWDERMWVIGGKTEANQAEVPYADVWFSRDGTTWEQSFDFPTTVYHTYAHELDGHMFVFGGVGNTNFVYKQNLG